MKFWNKAVAVLLGLALSFSAGAQFTTDGDGLLFSGNPQTSFQAALQTTLVPESAYGSSTPTFTRASTAYQTDFEGRQVLVPSGAARMQGARVVQQLLTGGASFATQSVTTIAGTYALSFDAASTGTITLSGTASGTLVGDGASVKGKVFTTTAGTLTLTLSVGTGVNVLLENLTGVTNSNPSDVYVDDATSYGAGINGARYSANLNASTLSGSNLTRATGAAINSSNAKFAVLPGVAGIYFSTPNAAANQITGDIDIRVKVALSDWTPAILNQLVDKDDGAAQRSFQFGINTDGKPRFIWFQSGAIKNKSATVATGFVDATAHWLRVTLDVDNGASGNDVKFYTSEDGLAWVQLGTTVTTAGATSIDNSTAIVSISSIQASEGLLGNIYRAQIYNGINGTLAVDFNPNDHASGATFPSKTTGETWTINGNAKIFGSNSDATYGIPAQWDANGPLGEVDEPSQANLIGTTAAKVRTMTDVGWVAVNMTVATTVGVDGVTASSARLTATNANATILFTPGLGAGVRTYAPYIKRITGVGAISITGDVADGYVAKTITAAYAQYSVTSSSAVPVVGYKIATSGDAIDVDFNELVAGSIAPALPIPVNVTTAADVLQYVSAGNLGATNSGTMSLTPATALGSTVVFHFATYVDANNYTAVLSDGTNLIARKRIGGANHDATIAWTRMVGTAVKVGWRFDGVNGSDIWLNGTKGTNDATLTAAQIGTNFQIGADGNGASQDYSEHRLLNVYPASLPAWRLTNLTTASDATDWLSDPMWRMAANDEQYRLVANR